VTKRSNYQKGEGRRAGAAERDSITAWPDRIWLKVELVLLLHRCMVAVVADHNEDGRSCWLSAGGWELFVFVVRSCLP